MKRGTIREDGKVFARMLEGKEIWITKEQYDKREATRKNYVKRCQEMYKKYRKEIRSFGDYDHKRNLYFIGISSSGKEVWRSKAFLEKRKKQHDLRKKEYNQRCHQIPNTNLKFGDQHPENPNLFVINKVGNKCFFASKKKLEEKKERLKMIYTKRHFKSKKIKQIAMKNITIKLKRGTTRSEDNYIFFEYNRVGKEVWLPPDVYTIRREKDLERRRNNRKKSRETKQLIHFSQENIHVENTQNICLEDCIHDPC